MDDERVSVTHAPVVSRCNQSPMELQVFSSFCPSSRFLPSLSSSPPSASVLLLHRRLIDLRFRTGSVHRRRYRTAVRSPTPSGCGQTETAESSGEFWTDSKAVEVIGIGSRKDAVLTFCLDSPFQSLSLRFWLAIEFITLPIAFMA